MCEVFPDPSLLHPLPPHSPFLWEIPSGGPCHTSAAGRPLRQVRKVALLGPVASGLPRPRGGAGCFPGRLGRAMLQPRGRGAGAWSSCFSLPWQVRRGAGAGRRGRARAEKSLGPVAGAQRDPVERLGEIHPHDLEVTPVRARPQPGPALTKHLF